MDAGEALVRKEEKIISEGDPQTHGIGTPFFSSLLTVPQSAPVVVILLPVVLIQLGTCNRLFLGIDVFKVAR